MTHDRFLQTTGRQPVAFGSPMRQPMGLGAAEPGRNPAQQLTPPMDTKELADKYFNRDPSLLER